MTGPILGIRGIGVFFRAHFLKKGHFVCLHPLNRCHFILFLMKYFFQNSGHEIECDSRTQQRSRIGPAWSIFFSYSSKFKILFSFNHITRYIILKRYFTLTSKSTIFSYFFAMHHLFEALQTQPAFTCSKLTIETLERGVEYVQS